MPRKGQSEEKIVYALRQVESGKRVSEVCREMGVSAQAFRDHPVARQVLVMIEQQMQLHGPFAGPEF